MPWKHGGIEMQWQLSCNNIKCVHPRAKYWHNNEIKVVAVDKKWTFKTINLKQETRRTMKEKVIRISLQEVQISHALFGSNWHGKYDASDGPCPRHDADHLAYFTLNVKIKWRPAKDKYTRYKSLKRVHVREKQATNIWGQRAKKIPDRFPDHQSWGIAPWLQILP